MQNQLQGTHSRPGMLAQVASVSFSCSGSPPCLLGHTPFRLKIETYQQAFSAVEKHSVSARVCAALEAQNFLRSVPWGPDPPGLWEGAVPTPASRTWEWGPSSGLQELKPEAGRASLAGLSAANGALPWGRSPAPARALDYRL